MTASVNRAAPEAVQYELDTFAVIAELVSAVGVILSLVYVGFQVRQNTRTMHASSLEATIGASNFVREQIVANADVASLYNRGNIDPHQLTDEERVRYRILVQSICLDKLECIRSDAADRIG